MRVRVTSEPQLVTDQVLIGPALCSFLKEADPQSRWAGLYRTPTPDGNILWLCDQHRKPFLSPPLVVPGVYPAAAHQGAA